MSVRIARRMDGVDRTLIRRIFDSAPEGSINLGLGQPDLATPPSIALAGIEGIARGRTAYTSTGGDPFLRAAIAERYRPFASGPESVAVTVGSQEACFAAMLTLLDPGDEVLVPDPGYPAYPVVARLLGASARAYPLRPERGFHLDPEEVESLLGERTRLVIVCTPSNPTGAVERAGDLERLAEALRLRGIAWLSDEIYSAYAYEGPVPSLSAVWPEGGVVVSGLSKDVSMTGWRIGWVVGPGPAIGRIVAAHQYLVTCAPSVSQWAARTALGEAGERARGEILTVFRRRREVAAEALRRIPGIEVEPPEGAFYFFVDVRRFGSSLELAERLLRQEKVIVIPGEAFGTQGSGFLRVSFAASEDDIRNGIAGLGRVLVASDGRA
jgi:aspartate/methionine/tyrosine aminotransferase